jgi:thiol-disulfide isomerase/thioredoxin
VGAAAPAFHAETSQGALVSLETLEGKVAVLDFWATWCPPCRTAGPYVQKLHERYADNDGVTVLGIHFDDQGDPVAYMAEHGYTFPVIVDGRDVVKSYGITRIPTFLVIDRSGTVVYKQVGFGGSDDLGAVAGAVDENL